MAKEIIEGYRLSPQQEHTWLLQRADARVPYRAQCAALVEGNLELSVLKAALDNVLARHEVLRTTFHCLPDMEIPIQVISEHSTADILFHDLSQLDEPQQETTLNALYRELSGLAFDFERDPLLHLSLIRLSPSRHQLFISLPALCTDHTGLKNLLREISLAYAACVGRSEMADEPMQYVAVSEWLNELLEAEDTELGRDYWRKQQPRHNLNSILPLQKQPSRDVAFAPRSRRLSLAPELCAKIKARAEAQGSSLQVFLMTCWQVLIWKHTELSELTIGIACDGRTDEGLAELPGLLTRFVPLQTQLEAGLTFSAFLDQVEKFTREAYEWQEFYSWKRSPRAGEGTSKEPFFPLCFEYVQGDASFAATGVRFTLIRQHVCLDRFQLKLACCQYQDAVFTDFHYDPDSFTAEAIDCLADQFQQLLVNVTERPEEAVGQLDLLSPSQRKRLLSDFNHTFSPFPPDATLHQLFLAQVRRSPLARALSDDSSDLSYAQLNESANQLSHFLLRLKSSLNAPVAILMDRSPEMVISLLAVLKSGAAYLPLDPSYPAQRLQFMLEDAGVRLLLTQSALRQSAQLESLWEVVERGQRGPVQVVSVDQQWAEISRESTAEVEVEVSSQQLAYVIYTSGSTGRPKGVMISHHAICNHMLWMQQEFPLTAQDRVLQKTPFSFDASVWEFYAPLLAGATLVLARPGGHQQSAYLVEVIGSQQITVLQLVPSMLHAFVEEREVRRCTSLRRVFCGGEALSVELAERFHGTLSAPLTNLYGPTEAAIDVTFWQCRPQEHRRSIPIGHPIANTRIYILDGSGEPTPIGVSGELHIGGAGLARGYLGRAELTAEKFIPDSYGREEGARLYRTGDVGRWLAGGEIEYVGRRDEQVKVRGYRIELGEVEAVARQQEGVREAVVVVREDVRVGAVVRSQQIVCYVVWEKAEAERAAEQGAEHAVERPGVEREVRRGAERAGREERKRRLQAAMGERLPEYMVPTVVIEVEELPRQPNGKVDRKRLPEVESGGGEYLGASNEVEEELSRIWAEVLGVERVGVEDNFFEMGGDSILGIQIVARANDAGMQMRPRDLFQHQTIRELATVAGTASVVVAEQEIVTGPVPLTPIQHRFFETHPLAPHHYNQSVILKVPSGLSLSGWRRIFHRLLIQHDGLRLRFHRRETGWEQVNAEIDDELPFILVDLSMMEEAGQPQAIDSLAAQAQASLSLSHGPLLRVVLFVLGRERQARLLIIAHHLIVDGVSWRILLEDLQHSYDQLSRHQHLQLPPKTTSFRHWALSLAQHAQSASVRESLTYWVEQLHTGAAAVPVDQDSGVNTVASAQAVKVSLSEEETRALLQEVPGAYRTQINDVLLAGLVEAYGGWSGERRLVVDVEGHGREEVVEGVDVTRTVGWFTSYFPVVLKLEAGLSLVENLNRVKEQLREASQHRMSYALLRYVCADKQVSERVRALPQAEVIFNYLGQLDQTLGEKSGFTPAPEGRGEAHSPLEMRHYLLEINGEVIGGKLQLTWVYSAHLHERASIEALAENYLRSLRRLVAHCRQGQAPGYTAADFPLAKLGQEQFEQLLADEAGIEDVYPLSPMQQGMLFHSLYETEGGVYFVQQSYALREEIDAAMLERAWQQVIDRYPSLRTSFLWEELDEPLQVVRRHVRTPWEQHDWSALSPAEQQERLQALLRDDRARGFNLKQPTLMRMILIRLSDDTYQFIWSNHQILLDGWSVILVLREVTSLYEALREGRTLRLEERKPYRSYIEWLQRQDLSAAEQFWRRTLRGFTAPTTLGVELEPQEVSEHKEGYGRQLVQLSSERTTALQSLTRRYQLTLNTLMQGTWALLLHSYSGDADVVFGATTSGRPAELVGVEFIVGLFINTLPVRVLVDAQMTLLEWLKQLQEQQAEARQYEYSPLTQVQGWSDVPRRLPLFESLLVFENYPEDDALRQGTKGLKLSGMEIIEQTNYPLSLVVGPGERLNLQVIYDGRRYAAETISHILGDLEKLLDTMTTRPEGHLSDLLLPIREQSGDAEIASALQQTYREDRFSF